MDIRNLRFWCQKVLPLVYDDSLSYYELLCKVVWKLNEVIDTTNTISETVRNEVKIQINELVESGEFKQILTEAIGELSTEVQSNKDAINQLNISLQAIDSAYKAGDAQNASDISQVSASLTPRILANENSIASVNSSVADIDNVLESRERSFVDFKPYDVVANDVGNFLQACGSAGDTIVGLSVDTATNVYEVGIVASDYNTLTSKVSIAGMLNHFNDVIDNDNNSVFVCGGENRLLKVSVPSLATSYVTLDAIDNGSTIYSGGKCSKGIYLFGSNQTVADWYYELYLMSNDLTQVISHKKYRPDDLFGGVTGRWASAQGGFCVGDNYYLCVSDKNFNNSYSSYHMLVFDDTCTMLGSTPNHGLFEYGELEGVYKINDSLIVGYVIQEKRSVSVLMSIGGGLYGDASLTVDAGNTLNNFRNSKYLISAYYMSAMEGVNFVRVTVNSNIDEDFTGFRRMNAPIFIAGGDHDLRITSNSQTNMTFTKEIFSHVNLKKLPTHDESEIHIYNSVVAPSEQCLYAASSLMYLRATTFTRASSYHLISTYNCVIVSTNNTIAGTGVAPVSVTNNGGLHTVDAGMFKDY